MSKPMPISDILRKIRPLALHHQAAFLRSHIAVESGGNIHKTSVRIRELQAALQDIQMRRLKRERAA
jgi:hypothetical protein